MPRKPFLIIMLSLIVIAFVAGVSAALAAPIEINFGHCVEPTDNYGHSTAVKFQELVKKYSKGKAIVNIYPAGQLGTEQDLVRSVQMGTVQVTYPAINNFSVFAPALGYYLFPYMFDNVKEFRDLTDVMWEQNNKWAIEQAGCRILTMAEIGFRQVSNSKRPVKTLADLKGLRIRVPKNRIMINAFASFGVEPVAMAWSDVFNALQQKVIDGQDNNFNLIRSQKFYEVQKYITTINYLVHGGCIIISEKFFQSLPKDVQEAIVKAGKDAMTWERKYADNALESDLKFLKSKGMEILPEPADKAEWVKRARASWKDDYEILGKGDAKRGKEIIAIIDKARDSIK